MSAAASPSTGAESEPRAEAGTEPEARAEPEPPPPSGVAWGRFAAYVGGGNAVLALGLGLAWFVFGRTRKPAEAAA